MALSLALFAAPFSYAEDLLQIYNLALQQDPELGQARAQYRADHTRLAQSRANFLPSVSLTGSSARNTYDQEARYSYADGFNTHGYRLSLQQSLVNLENWYRLKSAKAGDRGAELTLLQAEQDMIVRVASAYFDVLRSQDSLEAFSAEEEAAAAKLEEIRRRYEVGLEAITNVNAEQANYDLARVNRINEERRLNQRRLSLEVITGRGHDELEELSEDFPIVGIEPDSADDWVALAARNSPEVQIAEASYESRINDAKAARSALLPTLSLGANYMREAEASNQFRFVPDASINTAISLTVTVPLFQGGVNWAQKRQAYHQRDASEQNLLLVRRMNERSTRDGYLGVETGVLAVEARRQAIVSAQSALDAVEAGAEIGTHNSYDVVLAQRTLYQALRDYAAARYDYVLSTLQLKQAAGVLTPEDLRALNEWLE